MNRVVHFEIQAENPARAIKFYQEIFGWDFQKWDGGDSDYWMVLTASSDSKEPGINGGLLQRPGQLSTKMSGANAFVCTVQVDNFDATAEKIALAGGLVAMPKMALVGMAWQGYFLDTEGNVFGVHQPDTDAK